MDFRKLRRFKKGQKVAVVSRYHIYQDIVGAEGTVTRVDRNGLYPLHVNVGGHILAFFEDELQPIEEGS